MLGGVASQERGPCPGWKSRAAEPSTSLANATTMLAAYGVTTMSSSVFFWPSMPPLRSS
ncbi:hypothetical protein TBK1r_16570 [Stieleria magnilauensis]|uniref:Uncharacterized protein n=1 Tax=Stieleria magnilauensis TaxID=2527963 RepID=A0ABX5XL59_9BACT|nr:hypothetical protein TBK1r_16570 [Planctomycetes bacterium TBK1r]